VKLLHGDCLEVLRTLPDNSVDAVVTDPPYGLSFMGKRWDYDVPSVDVWAECLRVLKPGGHLLAFAGTRTQHRMAMRIEDAGFEIRDMIAWVYGSGFPKSLDVSKAIDKARGDQGDWKTVGDWLKLKREAAGYSRQSVAPLLSGHKNLESAAANMSNWENGLSFPTWDRWQELRGLFGFGEEMDAEVWRLNGRKGQPGNEREDREVTAPGGNDIYQPTQRVINPGTPVLDAARQWQGWGTALKPALEPITVARKPLIGTVAENVLAHGTGAINVDGCRVPASDGYTENAVTQGINMAQTSYALAGVRRTFEPSTAGRWPANLIHDGDAAATLLGDAARFFYCAKASRSDRGADNVHPTVKPTDLMRYLCRLVTPPNGLVLDPFMGSGSTGKAARLEGFDFIGIEREAEYLAIAQARIMAVDGPCASKAAEPQPDLFAGAA
jgi:SAM-dependent methyltransferase